MVEMKYIRTKHGRILKIVKDEDFDDEEKVKIPNDCTMVYASNMFGCSIISNKNIIKQADTIEELCDCLVLWKNIIPIKHSIAKADIDEQAIKVGSYTWDSNKYKEAYSNTYGAIWTDTGLIYVAKMNSEGVLELL